MKKNYINGWLENSKPTFGNISFFSEAFLQKSIFQSVFLTAERSIKGTVLLNVGGAYHQVKWETIDKFPKSRLQKLRYATTQGREKIESDSESPVQSEAN